MATAPNPPARGRRTARGLLAALLAGGLLLSGCQPSPDTGEGAASAGDATGATNDSDGGDMQAPARGSPQAARDVLQRYYQAIDSGDYRSAYTLWSPGAQDKQNASGKTFEQFKAGFAHTQSSRADIGEPGRIEGAAGSRYIEIPVTIRARLDDGQRQRFSGRYTLRRVGDVDGASRSAKQWHLYSADLQRGE